VREDRPNVRVMFARARIPLDRASCDIRIPSCRAAVRGLASRRFRRSDRAAAPFVPCFMAGLRSVLWAANGRFCVPGGVVVGSVERFRPLGAASICVVCLPGWGVLRTAVTATCAPRG
jgi:hypothetical protein